MFVPGPRMEAGHFFASESVKIASQPFNGLGDLLRRPLPRALKQHVFDEMADAIHLGWLEARTNADPQPDAYAGHVSHFCGGDRQAIGELADLIHRRKLQETAISAGFNG